MVVMIKKTSKKRALTRDYIVRATYRYLQRFATTEKNLKDVLERKVRRCLFDMDGESDEQAAVYFKKAQAWIDDIVKKTIEQNFVNDRQFGESRAKSLIRQGNSKMQIIQKLQAKGVASDMVLDIMQGLSEQTEDQDFFAAIKYIKKRRFGAFNMRRLDEDDGIENMEQDIIVEKELASLCRAGFSYTMGRKILTMPLEELEDGLTQNTILQ